VNRVYHLVLVPVALVEGLVEAWVVEWVEESWAVVPEEEERNSWFYRIDPNIDQSYP